MSVLMYVCVHLVLYADTHIRTHQSEKAEEKQCDQVACAQDIFILLERGQKSSVCARVRVDLRVTSN